MTSLCLAPSEMIRQIKEIEGPVDVYTWFEGTRGIGLEGASFMKEEIIKPLISEKKDVKICLYSLKGWDFAKNVESMPLKTEIGEQINKINNVAIKCIFAASFFRYCSNPEEYNRIYGFVSEELPKKRWLFELSSEKTDCGKTVAEFFDERASLFDFIKDMDVKKAYSLMQYVEGYFLVRESVERAIQAGQPKVEVFFALPNDEIKYYQDDFVKDIQTILKLDFLERIEGIEINVNIKCFSYKGSLDARPYFMEGAKIKPKDIARFLELERGG